MSRVASVLALVLLVVGLPASSATAAPDDAVRAGSFNIDRDRGFAAWRRATVAFRRSVDVAGMQEVTSVAKRRFLAQGRWGVYGSTPGPDENPVIWDGAVFRRVGAQAVRIADRQGRLPATYATVVRLRHRATGASYAVLNVHLIWGAHPDRQRLRRAQVRGLALAADRERAAGRRVLVVGDFNVDHAVDRRQLRPGLPARRLGAVGLLSAWDTQNRLPDSGATSTVGAGYVDNIWSTDAAVGVRTLGISGGQHHPVVATYDAGAAPTSRQHPAA